MMIFDLKKRKLDCHKGDCGKVLVVAGNTEMTGAASMTALSAFRTGTGLVYLYVPRETFPVFQTVVMEAICIDRNEELDIADYDSIAFGPGLGKSIEARDMLIRILDDYSGRLVIDADGINLISVYDLYDRVRQSKADIVLTPHEGEAERLLPRGNMTRAEWAGAISVKLDAVTVLKGHETVVTDGEDGYVNTTGNPGMATAGAGDVLTGVVASLLGQGNDTFTSACAGVYIHGLAGDIAKERIGMWGLMSRDIITYIPEAITNTTGE